MTSIINDNPMKLLDRFIFSRLTDGQRIRQVQICIVTRGDNFSLINIQVASRHLWTNQCAHQRSLICFYCSAHNLDLLIMGYPKIVEDAKGVMYLNFYENMP